PPPPPPPPPPPHPPPPPPPAPLLNLGNYQQTMIDQHNVHRRNHSAPDLAWDGTLAQYATNTANTCVFQHDMNQGYGGYGQNLASWGSSGFIDDLLVKMAASGVTEQWYNGEVTSWQYYGQPNPPPGTDIDKWGHFTQVVWKSSTKVGCATVKCPAGTVLSLESWYTVCNYNPPGNFGGEYGSNVLVPLGKQTVHV
ncbi:Cell wall protein PRY3, partial [Tolypocladium capitatum]